VSYLDDPRVYFAAERTLLAWQRTGIALIGLGFVVERFGLFMRMVAGGAALPKGYGHASLVFGVAFLLIGSAVSLIAAWQFRRFLRELSQQEVPRGHSTWLGPATNALLSVVALAMALWFVLQPA
jgi:putative membrane protein